jgi:hypothetical protein
MKNENYLLNLHKIIPLWYEDVQQKKQYKQKKKINRNHAKIN